MDRSSRCRKSASGCFLVRAIQGEKMKKLMIRLWTEEEGQDLTEYALLLVLLSLAAIGALGTLASAINSVFQAAASNLTT
jgi:Flp pilus assembly pilin Flp